ncbi:ArdC-like ssDNA-binding domain-containing protein [Methylobacillus sp. Pita2]|uniref:ArdC-like ssDNA-binding domain-containing protein n=1 Tax=Methylobacillus sp. Pita2 TaxID=3383245 RepID=UPI0038B67EEF
MAFNAVLAKILGDQMPWQVDHAVLMPMGLSGKQIANINYMLLANENQDSRWASAVDLQNLGLAPREGEKPTHIVHWWKARTAGEGDDVSQLINTAAAVPVFNLAQVDHNLPTLSTQDALFSGIELQNLAKNAGVHLVFDENDNELYLEDTVNVEFDNPTPDNVGLVIAGLVAWARDEHKLNIPANDTIGSKFLDAVAISMLASEYGVPVPAVVREELAARKGELVAHLEANPAVVLSVSRQAWEVRQFINQYAPASVDEHKDGNTAYTDASNRGLPSSPKTLY